MNASTDARIETLFKKLMNKVHPDKVADEHKDEANELMKQINVARSANDYNALNRIWNDLNNGKYFKPTKSQKIAALTKLRDDGKTKEYAKAYCVMEGWERKESAELIKEVYGEGRGTTSTQRPEVVKAILNMEANGRDRKQMIAELCTLFDWKEATAATLLAHLGYMHEYAKQKNS